MKFRTLDGEVLEADSFRHLAEQLWQTKFIPEPTLDEWMRASAKRAAMFNGSVIRTGTPEMHIEDLIKAGFLTRLG